MVEPVLLTRGVVSGEALAAAASRTYDVEVSGDDWIVVQGDLTGSANGDLTVTVAPYSDDGVTLTAFAIVPSASGGPTNQSGRVRFYGKYDVLGIGKVRITWTNNNAGSQTLNGSWRTAGV